MARLIRVTCHTCTRQIDLPPHKFLIWSCTSHPNRDFYTYTCPDCSTGTALPAPAVVVGMLSAEGVPRRLFTLPLELNDPERQDVRPLTMDDQLDLTLAIREWGVRAA